MTEQQVEPGTARWKALVEDGTAAVALVEQDKTLRNWKLGDAALEIAPMGDDRRNNGGYENLQRYAEEVGVSFESLRSYRQTAAAWAHDTRVSSVSHKVHAMLAKSENQHLIEPGMTVTGAHKALGQSTAGRTGPRSDTSAKVEQAKSLLAEEDVAARVFEDRETRRAATAAADRAHEADPNTKEFRARHKRATEQEKGSKKAQHTFRYVEADAKLVAAKKSIIETLGVVRGVEFSEEESALLAGELESLRHSLHLVELAIAGSTHIDWDAEFAKIGGEQ